MRTFAAWVVSLAAGLSAGVHAQAPQPNEFAWRAPVEVPAAASLVRVELPASALVRVQSPQANDVRVFNSAGEAVPFAWVQAAPQPGPTDEKTPEIRALPLYSIATGARKVQGAVQVHVGGSQPVWVRVDGAPVAAPDAKPLDAALFDTRGLKQPIAALEFDARLPANTPVAVSVSTSPDLAQWTPAPVRGRLYRFEGDHAPQNLRLAFDQPQSLDGRYLRIDWAGQPGVSVASVTGVVTRGAAVRRVRAPLPALRESGPNSVEIATGFSAPIAAIALSTPRDNTLLPVRVLGRNDNAQPWVILGQTVVYRLGSGDAMTNPPLEIHGASVRQLRIVATNGAAVAPAQLRAEAEFAPRQLVFLASGSPPFTLAAGRTRTDPAALPAATLVGMLGSQKAGELPVAKLGAVTEAPPAEAEAGWLPGVANKTTALWAVLLIGVAVLGGVAWSLARQMR
jgi:hypothetical protein